MSEQQNPQAGWYIDPSAPLEQRYWDGITWTNAKRPVLPQIPSLETSLVVPKVASSPSKPLKKKQTKGSKKNLFLVVGLIVTLLGLLLTAIGSKNSLSPTVETSSLSASDQKYLAQIASNFAQSKFGDMTQIDMGHAACGDLTSGTTGIQEMGVVEKSLGLDENQAIAIIAAAVNAYCPENKAMALSSK